MAMLRNTRNDRMNNQTEKNEITRQFEEILKGHGKKKLKDKINKRREEYGKEFN